MAQDRPTIDAFEGCILGHAVGDALGAPVEFMSLPEIRMAFGPDGLDEFVPWSGFPKGSYTDDTQMMRATAAGLLGAQRSWMDERMCDVAEVVHERYLEWLVTQDYPQERRFPGESTLTALGSGEMGTVDDPVSDSKGSGGIMRLAPVGLAFAPCRAFEVGAEIAAITHGHPTGYLSAAVYADVLSRVVRGAGLSEAIADARELLLGWDDYDETLEKLDMAVELFIAHTDLDEAIPLIGEGWIAEEALAISLLCALNFPEDWIEGVLSAVNITGDSDTTGALTGALMGARLGLHDIPGYLVRDVEDSAGLRRLADDLHAAFVEGAEVPWERYPGC